MHLKHRGTQWRKSKKSMCACTFSDKDRCTGEMVRRRTHLLVRHGWKFEMDIGACTRSASFHVGGTWTKVQTLKKCTIASTLLHHEMYDSICTFIGG